MPPSPSQQPVSANQGLMSLVVALLVLNAAGFLLLSIQFIAPKQQVAVVSTATINSKLDAIQAKLASFQAQVKPTSPTAPSEVPMQAPPQVAPPVAPPSAAY